MKRIALIALALLGLPALLRAQQVVVSEAFGLSAPLEADGRTLAVELPGDLFASLAKVDGSKSGSSTYELMCQAKTLEVKWKQSLSFTENEEPRFLIEWGTQVVVLVEDHNESASQARLKAKRFSIADGQSQGEAVLMDHKVGAWKDAFGKGGVKEHFQEVISAASGKGEVSPLAYRFEIAMSPRHEKLLVRYYDFSQPILQVHFKIYDTKLAELSAGQVPIDNNFINYGVQVSDRGDIFILNANRSGRIAVIQYTPATKANKFLDIQTTSSYRDNLRMQVLGDDVVYVASLNKKNGRLMGLTYAKFNFGTSLIERIRYHEVSEGLSADIGEQQKRAGLKADDWMNYELVYFEVNRYEKVLFAIEKREIVSTTFTYNPDDVYRESNWTPKTGNVRTGTMIFFAFNAAEELMWENYLIKDQQIDISDGLSTISANIDNTLDGQVRVIYAKPNNAGILNQIQAVVFDDFTGEKLRDVELPNDDKLALVTGYTVWFDNFNEDFEYQNSLLTVVGRKGLTGKKTIQYLYRF